MKLIFLLLAPPRSGTTLISNVIANNKNVCSLRSETNIFSWLTCFSVFEGVAGYNSYQLNLLRKKHNNVVKLIDDLSRLCKEKTNSNRFLEKTPQHVFHLNFITKHFPNAQIVNIVRDPRDGFLSSKSNDGVTQESPKSYGLYWKKSVEARRKLMSNPSIFDITYESLTNNPKEEIKKLMIWLGLDFEEKQISPGSKEFALLGKKLLMREMVYTQKS